MAAYANATRAIQLLIDRGADIDPVEKNWGNTPIDAAIYSQAHEAIDILGRYTRDVWCLTFTGRIDRLRELFREDPKRAKASYEGWTLLMRLPGDDERAAQVAELLLVNGADITSRTSQGLSALDIAEKRGLVRAAALLRQAGGAASI
jgi:ankyrin repeat protein